MPNVREAQAVRRTTVESVLRHANAGQSVPPLLLAELCQALLHAMGDHSFAAPCSDDCPLEDWQRGDAAGESDG